MNVLLIEPQLELAASVRDFLSNLGYRVQQVAEGKAGLKFAGHEAYDVIVLNYSMPKADGAQLCRRLRSHDPHTPLLLLTARDSLEQRLAGFEAGADDCLSIPFAPAELQARLHALRRRRRDGSGVRHLHVADLIFDLDALNATRGGKSLALNPTTRKLLEYLMRETRRVVPRAELEHLLWGKQVPEDDVLRVHLHALRAAVDKGHASKLIHTVHGVGYRLADAVHP